MTCIATSAASARLTFPPHGKHPASVCHTLTAHVTLPVHVLDRPAISFFIACIILSRYFHRPRIRKAFGRIRSSTVNALYHILESCMSAHNKDDFLNSPEW